MPSINVNKDRYDAHKKEVCEPNNDYKPRHFSALVLCLLEEILENQKKCQCCNCENGNVSDEQVIQNGIVNVNADIDAIVKNTKKQK